MDQEARPKTQIINVRNERNDITTNSIELKE